MSIEEQFNAAVKVIQSLPKDGFFQPSDEMRLRFYAFFKQATEGPNTTKKPPFYDIVNRYKWDAWKQCGQMSRDEAMKLYVEELKKVIETISMSHEVSEFLNILGPFYEFLPEEITNKNQNDEKLKLRPNEEEDNQVTTTSDVGYNNIISYDSEGDEFTDTFDTIPQNSIPTVFPNTFDQTIDRSTYSSPNNKNLLSNQPQQQQQQQQPVINSNNNMILGFNEQLTVAIFQLQQSVDRIFTRIHNIEAKQDSNRSRNNRADNRWPLSELSPKTTIFLFTWPVMVFFIMNYLKRFRKK